MDEITEWFEKRERKSERRKMVKALATTLMDQCRHERLTVEEVEWLAERMVELAKETAL